MRRKYQGFVLIELALVVSIIGILAAIAIPSYDRYTLRAVIADGLVSADSLRYKIEQYYAWRGRFPADNKALAINAPTALFSRTVRALEVRNGAIHIQFREGWRGMETGGLLTLQPAINPKHPGAPIFWSCAAEPPAGYQMMGERLTDLDNSLLPTACGG